MNDLQSSLLANGYMMRLYQLKGQSISSVDRQIIMRVRNQAKNQGYDQERINDGEMKGILGREDAQGRKVLAEFIGIDTMTRFKTRLYNVGGFHLLAGSTVGVITLVQSGILPRDINLFRVAFECLKEALLLALDRVEIIWEGL